MQKVNKEEFFKAVLLTKMMLILVKLFITSYFTLASGFQVKQIEGIEGQIKSINFDLNNNCYVVALLNESDHFHKLGPDKKIMLFKKFEQVKDVLINNKNDVYIFELHKIWILRAASKKINQIFQDSSLKELHFMDNDDNIFISTDSGISILRSEENIPIAIDNITFYRSFYSYAFDGEGNVYLAPEPGPSLIYVITKEAKMEPVPSAQVLKDYKLGTMEISSHGPLVQNHLRTYDQISPLGTDHNGNVYFITSIHNLQSSIIKFSNNSFQKILTQYNTYYYMLHATKDRTYFINKMDSTLFNIFFLTNNSKVRAVEGFFELPSPTPDAPLDKNLCKSDKYGTLYCVNNMEILSIQNNKSEVEIKSIPSENKISSIVVDQNDNLWVLAGNLYFFSKSSDIPVWVVNLPRGEHSPMKENKGSKEVYVGSGNGLTAVSLA